MAAKNICVRVFVIKAVEFLVPSQVALQVSNPKSLNHFLIASIGSGLEFGSEVFEGRVEVIQKFSSSSSPTFASVSSVTPNRAAY